MTVLPSNDGTDNTPVAPFQPTAPTSGGGGCGRYGIIGCGALILLLGIGAVVFLLKAGDLFAWAMSRFETEIVNVLPEDLGEEDRQRLHLAFERATEAVRSGEFDPLALQRLQSKLRDSILQEGGELSREDVMQLIETLEEVAGEGEETAPEVDDGAVSQIAAAMTA